MRTLAIECATDVCSAALFEDGVLLGGTLEVLGRGHAEWLVPIISDLPDRGRADRILVSLGPGSFTGVRVGLAAARALALAWKAECLGYPTLALVAAMARDQQPGEAVTVCMSGGHGEWFAQDFGVDGSPLDRLVSLTPSDANNRNNFRILAGSKAGELAILGGPTTSFSTFCPMRAKLFSCRKSSSLPTSPRSTGARPTRSCRAVARER